MESPNGRVCGPIVVNCAGSWAGAIDPRAKQPVRPIKGHILAVDARPIFFEHIVQGPVGDIVPRADGRTLIGATQEDVGFNKDVIAGSISALFERAARIIPGLRQARLLDTWAGLRPMSADRLPLIGRDRELAGLYWATGHLLVRTSAREIARFLGH